MNNIDPVLTALIALLPNLSISAVFVFAWFQERRERQANLITLLAINAANQAQLVTVIDRQFELMSRLHIEPLLPPVSQKQDGLPAPGPLGISNRD